MHSSHGLFRVLRLPKIELITKPIQLCHINSIISRFMIVAMMASLSLPTAYADIVSVYNDSCGACHDTGALNAPKKGDKARWQQLKSKKGMPTLIKSVKEGMPQMPAGGLCHQCTDEQYQQLIDYMSQ